MDDSLTKYSQDILPRSIGELSKTHEILGKAVKYLENKYLSDDQARVEGEAKAYLLDALGDVAHKIDVLGGNMVNYLDLQMNSVESLETQVQLIKLKLQLYKENHATERLNEMRAPVTAGTTIYAKKVGVDAPPPVLRPTMASRFSKFDDVGVCLNKDQGAGTGMAAIPGRSSGFSSRNDTNDFGNSDLVAPPALSAYSSADMLGPPPALLSRSSNP